LAAFIPTKALYHQFVFDMYLDIGLAGKQGLFFFVASGGINGQGNKFSFAVGGMKSFPEQVLAPKTAGAGPVAGSATAARRDTLAV